MVFIRTLDGEDLCQIFNTKVKRAIIMLVDKVN